MLEPLPVFIIFKRSWLKYQFGSFVFNHNRISLILLTFFSLIMQRSNIYVVKKHAYLELFGWLLFLTQPNSLRKEKNNEFREQNIINYGCSEGGRYIFLLLKEENKNQKQDLDPLTSFCLRKSFIIGEQTKLE